MKRGGEGLWLGGRGEGSASVAGHRLKEAPAFQQLLLSGRCFTGLAVSIEGELNFHFWNLIVKSLEHPVLPLIVTAERRGRVCVVPQVPVASDRSYWLSTWDLA